VTENSTNIPRFKSERENKRLGPPKKNTTKPHGTKPGGAPWNAGRGGKGPDPRVGKTSQRGKKLLTNLTKKAKFRREKGVAIFDELWRGALGL